jgi:ABC-type transport system involved in cytochrome c biogenesis permease subunit
MKIISIICYTLIVALLIAATFFEKYFGTAAAIKYFYHPWYTIALWGLAAALSSFYVIKKQLYKKNIAAFLLHCAFIIILAGALITHIGAKDGSITLYKNAPPITNNLPFSLQLKNFEVQTYKGTDAPSDYISTVLIIDEDTAAHIISMNNILSYRGYRFYQASFGMDKNSSTLLYSYDPFGTAVTYAGYFLFFISTVLLLIFNRRFYTTAMFKNAPQCLLIAACIMPLFAQAQAQTRVSTYTQDNITVDSLTLNNEAAAEWAKTAVVYNGRIVPLQTVATDFTKKLTGKSSYQYANAAQVLYGWRYFPQKWAEVPMFRIKNQQLQQIIFGEHPHKYATLFDIFNQQGDYKLEPFYNELYAQGKQNSFLKEASALNEKVQILMMLQNGELYSFSDPQHVVRWRLILEYYYERIALFDWLFMVVLTMGVICLALNFTFRVFRPRAVKFCTWLALALTVVGYITRWIIGSHIPLSNGHETMLFLALVLLIVTLIAGRKNAMFSSLGLLLSGLILLTANIANKNPQITSLMPVLNSPWLALHVSLMMISYALFALIFIAALLYFFLLPLKKVNILNDVNLLCGKLHLPATLLMGCGIFIGAIWANVSWGRYWGWDPKEVWALITFMLAAIPLHIRFKNPLAAHGFTIIIGLSILMTYFGVNAFLGGLHSY